MTDDDETDGLVPGRMINEYVYCPRLFYLEWVDRRFQDNDDTNVADRRPACSVMPRAVKRPHTTTAALRPGHTHTHVGGDVPFDLAMLASTNTARATRYRGTSEGPFSRTPHPGLRDRAPLRQHGGVYLLPAEGVLIFITRAGGVALTSDGRRAVLRAYERRLSTTITHPIFKYKVSYRRVLDVQARLLAAVLVGEVPDYVPMVTR